MPLARREALILGAAGLAAAGAGALVGAFALQSRSGAASLLSQNFRDLTGASRRLAEWRGRVIVCNFWATWCAPCREEIPLLSAAQHKYGDKMVLIVGIGIDNAVKISEFSNDLKISYLLLVAESETVDTMKRLGNLQGGLPFTVVLDRQGAVAHTRLGAFKRGDLDRILDPLVG
ncbi:MAG TPA: TlpA disulfide reductase family protein [Burkholderiales bacterium]